jgi:hypothetical protein
VNIHASLCVFLCTYKARCVKRLVGLELMVFRMGEFGGFGKELATVYSEEVVVTVMYIS